MGFILHTTYHSKFHTCFDSWSLSSGQSSIISTYFNTIYIEALSPKTKSKMNIYAIGSVEFVYAYQEKLYAIILVKVSL